MALIIRAPGLITNPVAHLPNPDRGLQLKWRAADIGAANNTRITEWDASFNAGEFAADRTQFLPFTGSAPTEQQPLFIANARQGVPAVRADALTRAMVAGWRLQSAPTSEHIKFTGDSITISLLMRYREFMDYAPSTSNRLFSSTVTAYTHGMRGASGTVGRVVMLDGGSSSVAPWVDLATLGYVAGNWLAMSVVFDKSVGQIRTVVNNLDEIATATGVTLPDSFASLSLFRSTNTTAIGDPGAESFLGDYAEVSLHNAALSLADIHEKHAQMKREYGISDW